MSSSSSPTRRLVLAGIPLVLAGCANPVGGDGAARIDARVDATLDYLFREHDEAKALAEASAGILVMPLITEAGFGIGGSYGRGALRIDGRSVDYYSTTRANLGPQIGAQQFAHALFFMTEESLQGFRESAGFALGVDAEVTILTRGESVAAETTTSGAPIVAIVFGQAGLRIGATIEGTKYSRIIP